MPLLLNLFKLLFPQACVICQKESSLFCPACQNQIDFLYFSPQLESLTYYQTNLQAVGFYVDPLASVIKKYKYQGIYELAPTLAQLLYKHLKFSAQLDYLTYIPLHPKKQRLRGFNQTELIAKELSLLINKPVINLFYRKFHTQSLASTKNQQVRAEVTQNVFKLKHQDLSFLKNKQLLIIDDVVTSGATFANCLKLLEPLKINKIQLMTLAHEG